MLIFRYLVKRTLDCKTILSTLDPISNQPAYAAPTDFVRRSPLRRAKAEWTGLEPVPSCLTSMHSTFELPFLLSPKP